MAKKTWSQRVKAMNYRKEVQEKFGLSPVECDYLVQAMLPYYISKDRVGATNRILEIMGSDWGLKGAFEFTGHFFPKKEEKCSQN